jgi:hypothetical protein
VGSAIPSPEISNVRQGIRWVDGCAYFGIFVLDLGSGHILDGLPFKENLDGSAANHCRRLRAGRTHHPAGWGSGRKGWAAPETGEDTTSDSEYHAGDESGTRLCTSRPEFGGMAGVVD